MYHSSSSFFFSYATNSTVTGYGNLMMFYIMLIFFYLASIFFYNFYASVSSTSLLTLFSLFCVFVLYIVLKITLYLSNTLISTLTAPYLMVRISNGTSVERESTNFLIYELTLNGSTSGPLNDLVVHCLYISKYSSTVL